MTLKRLLTLTALAVAVAANAANASADAVGAAMRLTQRLLPDHADRFAYVMIDGDAAGEYTLESRDGKIVIGGTDANAMAVGLNRYLQDYCLTTVSWYADVAVAMPAELPTVDERVTARARVGRRFFLNYCTYGYTMPFWGWPQWERLIDWMALNGVNMPLAITGQEAVWHNVWRKLGMTDEEVRSYFVGPAYLPWHRMANIDGWQGPLPQEWLDRQAELQKQILARERELAMRPVLPAFAGHVPAQLRTLYPDANIKHLGRWAGFADTYRCHFLGPEEPLFGEIQRLFLQEQTRLYGTDHIYGVDPFNEVDPPSWEPAYLSEVARNVYRTLADVDPQAEWMQMSWMFYHDSKQWTPERIKALLTGVPAGRMSLLDYHCEKVEMWQTTNQFYGQPYIWCYLGNFGGNTTMAGRVKDSGQRLDSALAAGNSNMLGIGCTLEGLDVMQFPYEYILGKAWTGAAGADELWAQRLADRHLGRASANVRKAWEILFDDVYVQVSRTLGPALNYRPKPGDNHSRRTAVEYAPRRLAEAWQLMLLAPDARRDAMALDLIVVGRQALGNLFGDAKRRFDQAYTAADVAAMRSEAALMQELMRDIDALCAHHPECTLQRWLALARDYSDNPAVKDHYERNARTLITTWGGTLNDYASRTWAGLVGDYYAGRWQIYFDRMLAAASADTAVDADALATALAAYEQAWTLQTSADAPIQPAASADLLTFSRLLFDKYSSRLLAD